MPKLPKHILKALLDNKTSLGEHPSFPPEEEEKFIICAVSKTFEDLSEKIGIADYETLKNDLSKILIECKKQEKKNIQSLEALCEKIITNLFQIPQDTINLEVNIVDKVNVDKQRLFPEKTSEDFSFDNIEDMNNLTDEIYKRRMLNSLVTGAAMYYMNYIGEYIKEIFEINSDLPSLYKKMIDYNTLLMYYEKDTVDIKNTNDGGKVDVNISSSYNKPLIKVEALLFPILVEETIKGILELAISHGLPNSIEKAKYVMSKSDFKLAELWDMRLGYALWKVIEHEVEKCGFDLLETGINFFFMELSEMDCEAFNKTLQEIFARTKKGRAIITEIIEDIEYKKNKDEFDDYIRTKSDSTIQLDDDACFTSEELLVDNEEYFLPEELITDCCKY